MKFCPSCLVTRDESEFHFRNKGKGTLQPYCKFCRKLRDAQRYKEHPDYFVGKTDRTRGARRKWWRKFKQGLSCTRCGENHPATLDFHHIDPLTKSFAIGEMLNKGASKKRIMAEVEKCEVLCANCHRKEHFGEIYQEIVA